ncbi:GTP-binding protein, partial [Anaerosporobacter sp.]|uniref:GTP-binding protein n=1 Tax=Anaerosporobacter sp. TaxID=1872529 RepID=UPI0028A24B23
MKKLTIGILAHVDAGKTTLSESMLYMSGSIRKLGRVDNGDAFLDTFTLERARGITIFSKQAVLNLKETKITLLDTPGHVDFSAEMERTLQVLDYAILVISGADGVQGHTRTLWKLLDKYKVPVFLFVNKMDQAGTNKGKVIEELRHVLDDGCIEFGDTGSEEFFENIAMCDETLLEQYMESGSIALEKIREMIQKRKVFPCFFGAALKLEGVEELMNGLEKYTLAPIYPTEFGAKIYKIARDEQGNRLTYMKVTGGCLKVKDVLTNK